MANGRSGGRAKPDSGRDPGAFVAIPLAVLDCPAYLALSHTARSLLLEVARQCRGDDNGRLLLSRAYLGGRGWKSADVIQRAKGELIDGGFIFETVKGHRPNKASWYAVTWRKLDKIAGFDIGVEKAFERGAYRRNVPMLDVKKLRGYQGAHDQTPPNIGASLIPPHGTESRPIAPSRGTGSRAPVPSDGAMRAVSGTPSVPSDGHPLELPSTVAGLGVPPLSSNGAAPPAMGNRRDSAAVAPVGMTMVARPVVVPESLARLATLPAEQAQGLATLPAAPLLRRPPP
jgi:hypothetical protein